MRIFAIGLGGAGCRIADTLYAQDRRFSKISCVEAIAIDRDAGVLNGLRHIPIEKKIYFPSLSLNTDDISDEITIDEVVTRVHNFDTGDRDAIIICSGAGGTMIDVALEIIPRLRSTMSDPVFGLFTLPIRNEGKRVSSKAAFDLERLKPILDGVILFDNEIWSDKAGAELAGRGFKGSVRRNAQLNRKKTAQSSSELNKIVNEGVSRRLGLLLRAGEFNESGGIEVGEVVLDAGEILNTIRGMGFIAIGYSAADLRSDTFSIHRILRPADYVVETGHKRASRLVDIAKEAIYENISIPCDMTSAQKALILVAGPSHEISMKGFMTVRKWIDRNIAGMEMRSGDYPVKTTHYIAIIIILAGIGNIPRIREINTIREEYTRENPDWIKDFYERSLTASSPAAILGKTLLSQETMIPGIIRSRLPAHGPDKQGTMEGTSGIPAPVRKIPFFSKHGVPAPPATRTEGSPPGTHVMDRKGGITLSANNKPGIVPGISSGTDAIPDSQTKSSKPVDLEAKNSAGKAGSQNGMKDPNLSSTVKDDLIKPGTGLNGNLASIVAKAREDLKKVDKK
jgi:tubulin-like protein CetZ